MTRVQAPPSWVSLPGSARSLDFIRYTVNGLALLTAQWTVGMLQTCPSSLDPRLTFTEDVSLSTTTREPQHVLQHRPLAACTHSPHASVL